MQLEVIFEVPTMLLARYFIIFIETNLTTFNFKMGIYTRFMY